MNTGIPPVNGPSSVATSLKATNPSTPQARESSPVQSAALDKVSLPVSNTSSNRLTAENNEEPNAKAKERPSLQEVIALSEKLNESIQQIQRDINFSVDDSLGEVVVKVIDRQTQEVIRQIPSDEMLALSRNIEEVNSLLFDKIKA